ncbi:MAG: 3-oxoacyl-ACP reductase FabG [Ruminobacter sp.]|jgi:3-oxoacyl-[acyl-carrier protein] reductase|uniref:3-oxoacyl-ACP reductase FabG n=1 Tax=Ruminobacter TaxID=866 RepID=UPI00257EFE5B|nr:3-oxoacyl-ACP reductase FabG [Ruminobacter sp.]MBQ3775926.1 3-oxoacyl-ACP reductase FabG [Ruminobacter sp.]
MDFSGKVVLVTGASRGIGRAIAESFAKLGAKVCGTATSESGAAKISEYLGENGTGLVLDVSSQESVDKCLEAVKNAFGDVDILVNNAGITRDNLLMRMKDEEWDAIINTNLASVYRMSKGVLRPMMKKRSGRIISVSSVVGLMGNPGQCNYAAAKAGLIGFSKSLAKEVASRGITVNCVAPGFIATDMTAALTEEQKSAILTQVPAGKLGDPQDIANAVLFLASDMASYITGETISVNGGMYM